MKTSFTAIRIHCQVITFQVLLIRYGNLDTMTPKRVWTHNTLMWLMFVCSALKLIEIHWPYAWFLFCCEDMYAGASCLILYSRTTSLLKCSIVWNLFSQRYRLSPISRPIRVIPTPAVPTPSALSAVAAPRPCVAVCPATEAPLPRVSRSVSLARSARGRKHVSTGSACRCATEYALSVS